MPPNRQWYYRLPFRIVGCFALAWSLYSVVKFGLSSGGGYSDEARIVGGLVGLASLSVITAILNRLWNPASKYDSMKFAERPDNKRRGISSSGDD